MVSPVLARTLASGRPHFNERVAEARHRMPGFDVEAFRGFVAGELDVVATAVEAAMPERVGDAVQVAWDLGIDLVGQALFGAGARLPWVGQAWRTLVPGLGARIAAEPFAVLAALTNAAVRLGGSPGVRMDQWLALMQAAGPECDSVDTLRLAGAVCGWRAGMVPLRAAALDALMRLPPTLARHCLGAPAPLAPAAIADALRADRWSPRVAGDAAAAGWVLGGFSGFGGPFALPPQLRATAAGFVAQCGERHFLVQADAFGAAVVASTRAEFDAAAATTEPLPGMRAVALAARLGIPEDGLRVVANGDSLAVASPWSHRLHVGPRT